MTQNDHNGRQQQQQPIYPLRTLTGFINNYVIFDINAYIILYIYIYYIYIVTLLKPLFF